MNVTDTIYFELVRRVLSRGEGRKDRTGVGTIARFGESIEFDLNEGFPIITTKRIHMPSVVAELLWFISGSTNNLDLLKMGCTIWNEWHKPYKVNASTILVKRKPRKDFVPFEHGVEGSYTEEVKSSKLYHAWDAMMGRCYRANHHRYPLYGAKGVFVSKEWHDFRVFEKDVKDIPQWLYKEHDWDNFQLDKDYYGAGYYSKDTCVWLHTAENVNSKGVVVTFPDGDTAYYQSLTEVSKHLGISPTTCHRYIHGGVSGVLKKNNKKFEGFTFNYIDEDSEYLVRPALIKNGELGRIYGAQWRSWLRPDGTTVDQLAKLIEGLKNDPTSRRHILSAWNAGEIDDMALPPCHMVSQYYVDAKNKLHCMLYQRSCDIFLGLPFNIASYAILTHLLARVCGYKVGTLKIIMGDAHIYMNHIDAVKTQLKRTPFLNDVRLFINPEIKNIDDFKMEDIKLLEYSAHPAIPAPVAV